MAKTQTNNSPHKTRTNPKKKSNKANVTSQMSEKRKLSRNGKMQKKGKAGPMADFITRSAALKKLQITLKDFRRLCILKGIYPRVPPKTPSTGADKIFYDIKDLTYLSHEPLLQKFRDFKAFMKKIRRSSGRNDIMEARRKDEMKPENNLNHLVKERYPRFIDALRDLDDTLCMIHLFAVLPSIGRVTAQHTTKCQELSRHWQYYVARSHSLTKTFVSVKGYYFQASILGENITWLVPHKFTQEIPKEVDVRVMITFLDFYEVFMKFVLYKLYSLANMSYPPVIDKELADEGSCLLAIKVEENEADANQSSAQASSVVAAMLENGESEGIVDKKSKKKGNTSAPQSVFQTKLATLGDKLKSMPDFDEYELTEEEKAEQIPVDALDKAFKGFVDDNDDNFGEEERSTFKDSESVKSNKPQLFSKLRFFCNREVPLEWMQLCVLSFGGQIGWEGAKSPYGSNDSGITHHIVDRPLSGDLLNRKDREFIQPQWIFDSINAQVKLPIGKYEAGVTLPPHLSPFVDDEKEGYVPKYREEIKKIQAAAGVISAPKISLDPGSSGNGKEKAESKMQSHAEELKQERKGLSYSKAKRDREDEESDEGSEDEDEEEEEEDEEEDEESDSDDDSDGGFEDKDVRRAPLEINKATQKGSKAIVYQPKDDLDEVSIISLNFYVLYFYP
jgi:pescadillo